MILVVKVAKKNLLKIFSRRTNIKQKMRAKKMNEINKNFISKISNIQNNNIKGYENKNGNLPSEGMINEIKDSGILGKSQVAKADGVNADIEFCKKASPEFLAKCDFFFEGALENMISDGEENAYEKACILTKEFSNEFVN